LAGRRIIQGRTSCRSAEKPASGPAYRQMAAKHHASMARTVQSASPRNQTGTR
jgi:hypothetical protein